MSLSRFLLLILMLWASVVRVKALEEKLSNKAKEPQKQDTQLTSQRPAGSVYVRWGKTTCPDRAKLVYAGVVGGGFWTHAGAAVNALCLPKDPQYDSQAKTVWNTYIYGAEYETNPEATHDLDVVCAVCFTPRAVSIMVPAKTSCPDTWSLEYSGHLMAGHYTHASATEYLCMDSAMEAAHSSNRNDNGKLFYYVLGQCGSLPCPPYQNDKVLACAVCSK